MSPTSAAATFACSDFHAGAAAHGQLGEAPEVQIVPLSVTTARAGSTALAPTQMALAPDENALIVAVPEQGNVLWLPIERCDSVTDRGLRGRPHRRRRHRHDQARRVGRAGPTGHRTCAAQRIRDAVRLPSARATARQADRARARRVRPCTATERIWRSTRSASATASARAGCSCRRGATESST